MLNQAFVKKIVEIIHKYEVGVRSPSYASPIPFQFTVYHFRFVNTNKHTYYMKAYLTLLLWNSVYGMH